MAQKRILSIDLETYSDVDLVSCGVYRYVEGDFHILLFAYAFDDEDVRCVDMACGEQLPQKVVDAIHDKSIIKAAWNAQFERVCLSKYFDTQLSPDDWQCSMVWAASLSLPLKLKNAAEVLKTGEQKDDVGERLIRYFSVPCKPTKANGGRTRNLPEHAPEDWKLFKSYCIQDVRTERDIRYRLEKFPLLPQEWNYYHMDQRINDRGVMIDKALVQQAIICDMMLSEEMAKRAYELTGLENPNSVSQLKAWLEERGMAETEKYGYYHATNEGGFISWYDFTVEIYKQAGMATKVTPVTTAEYGLSKAVRPFNSRLDKSKLVENGFQPLPTWQDALSRYLKEIM